MNRHRTCLDCKHEWDSPVVLSEHTANLSGEASAFCPACGSRNVMSDPATADSPIPPVEPFKRSITVGVTPANDQHPKGCRVSIDIRISTKETPAPHLDVDGNTIAKISELSMTGSIGQHSGGQNLEEIASLFPDNAPLQELIGIWRYWHLNGMRSGSRAQNAAIAAHQQAHPEWVYDYDEARAILAERGNNPDASMCGPDGYNYGSAWLCESLPGYVRDKVVALADAITLPAEAVQGPLSPDAVMTKLGLTVESVFVPWSQSRNQKAKPKLSDYSLNWRVALKRNGREVLTTDYSAGIAHCPSYKQGGRRITYEANAVIWECEHGKAAFVGQNTGTIMPRNKTPLQPKAADVLSSLVSDSAVLDAGGFEAWARDCGYDTDSRQAEAIYSACLDIALKLRSALGDDGMRELRSALEDY